MKKNWKKLVALGMAATMTAAALVGCGGSDSGKESKESKDGKVTLTMSLWDQHQAKVMKSMAEVYTKANPNVTIDIQETTWTEYWTKLEAGATGGAAPDLFWVNVLHAEEYADAGILADLTEVGKELDAEANFPKALVDAYTIDGKLYAIPKDFDTNAIFYNKEIFDKAGVEYPTDGMTMEDFTAKCEELKAAGLGEGVYPTAVNRNSGQTTYYSSINANGGYQLNEDRTKTGWDMPETIGGIEPWLNLVQEGLSPTLQQMSDTQPDAMFSGGKTAMYLSGNYMFPEYEKTLGLDKFDCVERPSFNGKKADIINGLGYCVSESSKNKEEALKFVTWLGSEEGMKLQAEGGVVISARNDAQEIYTEAYPDHNLKIFLQDLDQKKVFDHCKITTELAVIEKKYLDPVWSGEAELEDAVKNIVKEEQPLLDKMNGK